LAFLLWELLAAPAPILVEARASIVIKYVHAAWDRHRNRLLGLQLYNKFELELAHPLGERL